MHPATHRDQQLPNPDTTSETSRKLSGYQADEVRSALQKAIRRGREDEAAWWVSCFIEAGQVRYVWRVFSLIASEDIGMGDSSVAISIDALARNAERATDGFTKGHTVGVVEMHALLQLCRARKDWQATHLLLKQRKKRLDISRDQASPPPIPPEAIDAHTREGRRRGVPKTNWYLEGDALEPKSSGHHCKGADPHGHIHGDSEVV